MSDLTIYLENVLLSLQQDVAPSVTVDRARTSVKAISNVLARMIVNLRAADTHPGSAATPDTPEAAFEGPEAHAAAAREAAVRLEHSASIANIGDLVRWESELLGPMQAESLALIAGPPTPRRDSEFEATDSSRRFEAYLRERYGPSAALASFHDVFGGRSKITSLLEVAGCPELSGQLAMRRDAAMNLTGGRSVVDEYPILRVLHERGVKVPKPILVEPDPAPLGAPFILVERLGGACGEIYRAPPSVPLMKSVAGLLAKLHSIPLAAYADAGVSLPVQRREAVSADIAGIERMWVEGGGPTSIAMPTAFKWLQANLDCAFQGEPSLAHCDARFHNILFDADRVTGLLDWELARASYPAEDLGYIRPIVCRTMPWPDFMRAYAAAGGPPVAEDQIDFYAVFCAARFASLSASVKKLILSRQTKDVQLTAVPLHDIYIWIHEISEHLLRVASYG